jgi:hypothetical protein
MARRRRFAMAGGIFATVFAGTVALGANFGLFGLTTRDSPVGRIPGAAAGVRPSTSGATAGGSHAPGGDRPDYGSPDADD